MACLVFFYELVSYFLSYKIISNISSLNNISTIQVYYNIHIIFLLILYFNNSNVDFNKFEVFFILTSYIALLHKKYGGSKNINASSLLKSFVMSCQSLL